MCIQEGVGGKAGGEKRSWKRRSCICNCAQWEKYHVQIRNNTLLNPASANKQAAVTTRDCGGSVGSLGWGEAGKRSQGRDVRHSYGAKAPLKLWWSQDMMWKYNVSMYIPWPASDLQVSSGLGLRNTLGAFSKGKWKIGLTPTFLRKLFVKDHTGKSCCDSVWLEISSCFVLQENVSGPWICHIQGLIMRLPFLGCRDHQKGPGENSC